MDDNYKNLVSEYLSNIQKILSTGDAREHAYRSDFKKLIENLVSNIQVINEPAYTGGNAPDFLFKKGETPIAYAECKDVTVDIKNIETQKQAKRYVEAFGKILLTNYYDFEFILEEGEKTSVSIATKDGNKIIPTEENFDKFVNLIQDYINIPSSRTIKSAKRLAEIMASKARIIRDNALASLNENKESEIFSQYESFKQVLIRDLSENEFADMYAQTLVYGLFVARYYDKSLQNFSRHEAQDLLPSSNPLLKKFFGHVAGTDYDPKIAWLVDSLVETYLSTNVADIMHKEFEKKQKDPVLHFYETFLASYDKGLRKSRGVYYTPEPVVSFIVRSVDQILKKKFGLNKGLADTTKIDFIDKIQAEDGRTKDGIKQITKQIHKVQILDPAVGTGTFLNEIIHEIHKKFVGQEGQWDSYVRDSLLPRLHGFELMMASYTMAHLKLGITLNELGYKGNERLSVWLTNSLEESVHEVPNLFMSKWLTEESNQASKIKSEMPIMVVLGNPPYSVSSVNKGENIQNLIKVYKENLNERKINLDDDYIKFIRFAENQIEKTGYGMVAMITNNSFIDGITHRQMRKHLLETFDEIYILDLHGNAKKKETTLEGGKDENVFNIMQGVSINLFIKTGTNKNLAKIYHSEIFGKHNEKYMMLDESSFETTKWKKLKITEPYYFFVPKDFEANEEYEKGFKVDDFFKIYSSGIETQKDSLVVQKTKEELKEVKNAILYNEEKVRNFYKAKESRDWKLEEARKDLENSSVEQILYRPFDLRFTFYSGKTKGIMAYPRDEIMQHFIQHNNLGLLCCKRQTSFDFQHTFITDKISERCSVSLQTGEVSYCFPLYLYADDGTKVPNLDKEIWKKINEIVGETKPENILDYIYAVLHSPKYREKYKEFLKIDFPRVSYPENKEKFWNLVELGKELRELHLLESPEVSNFITTFPESGLNIVEKKYPKYEDKKVFINETQYFGNVPEISWNFYIGGYQPAQKWLKDRREQELKTEDLNHYQEMIVSLTETHRIMQEIDKI